MRSTLAALLVFGCLGCESNIPNYVLTAPTTPSPSPTPTPTPTPPPSTTQNLNLIFSVGPISPVAGASTAFNAIVNPSPTAPTTYSWNFGDGATRVTDAGTTFYAYNRVGVFDASVIVADGSGRTVSGSAHVTVHDPPPPPPPDPPVPTPPPASLAIALTCTPKAPPAVTPCNVTASYGATTLPGSAVTKVDWDWGDGAQTTTAAPFDAHAYPVSGTFTVFATVTANVPTTPASLATVTVSKSLIIP